MKSRNLTGPGLLYIFFICSLFTVSCQKEAKLNKPDASPEAKFPTTDKEKQRVVVSNEITSVLKEVYKNAKAYHEVNAAIYSGYYEDETVLLKDLLTPQVSALYKSEEFLKLKAYPGEFKKEFFKQLNSGSYLELKKALGYSGAQSNLRLSEGVDTAMEIFSNTLGASIYFPYSSNFMTSLTSSYFDNINTDAFGDLATVIPADREANSAPGSKPSRHKTYDEFGEIVWEISYESVTVNDTYAEVNPVHIVGVGAEPSRIMPSNPPPGTNVNRVYHGWSRLTQQLDNFISFSGNGGGSEIKVARISGYLQMQNQQVTNFTGDIFTVSYDRKSIKKGIWKRVYGVWDADWVTANLEQVYACYEEDNQGSKTFTGSLGTTVTVTAGTTITASIGFSVTAVTQDELITQRKITRTAYFGAALTDQGWGFNLCDKSGGNCRYDNTFLSTGNWPAYDGNNGSGAIWSYTWPYNSY